MDSRLITNHQAHDPARAEIRSAHAEPGATRGAPRSTPFGFSIRWPRIALRPALALLALASFVGVAQGILLRFLAPAHGVKSHDPILLFQITGAIAAWMSLPVAQLAALLGLIVALKCVLFARSYKKIMPLDRSASVLLLVILLSLVIMGAGAFAFDLHI